MKTELAKKLYDKHGAVFKFEKTDPAGSTPFFMFGIECGDGWYDILNHLLFWSFFNLCIKKRKI